MKEYIVRYTSLDGDHCKVRVEAYNEEGAKMEAKNEHWDIKEIDMVTKA